MKFPYERAAFCGGVVDADQRLIVKTQAGSYSLTAVSVSGSSITFASMIQESHQLFTLALGQLGLAR